MASVSRGARRLVASRGRDLARCLSSDAPLPASPEAYCQELVQKADYDGYLTSLLLRPREVKPAVYAVRAFNVETATIKEAVRGNLAPGRLRLQWWRDVVASIYKWGGEAKPPQQHPIAAALADAIENRCLSRAYLDRMLDARLGDIEGNEHQSMSDLEAYAEQTASSMLHLTLEAIGLKEDRDAHHAADHVGKAIGICTMLRAVEHHCAHEHSIFPRFFCLQRAATSSLRVLLQLLTDGRLVTFQAQQSAHTKHLCLPLPNCNSHTSSSPSSIT
ncbi:unnamed protein product [Chrysoparadoxa australica]